jgi:hypothetical protein
LTFIQVPFEKIGAFCSAFFQHTYRTIFIDQEVPQAKKEALEKFICKQLIGCEYGRQYNLIYDNDALSEVEKARQVESLRAWLEATDKDSSLRDIKETLHETGDSCSQTVLELFILHEQELKKRINEYRFSKALNFVITKTNIPHEAFHDFYENQLTRPGYDGPTIEKLLAMALRGKRQRFGTKDPSYASIEEYLKGVKIDDEEVLSSFCKKITSQYDIVSTPKLYLNEEWRQFSDAQKWDYWTQRGLFVFLNEYLARVYNSALGNTPDQVLAELQKISAEFKREPPNFKLEEMYHKPFEEELKMLREMKWKGKSIIAN